MALTYDKARAIFLFIHTKIAHFSILATCRTTPKVQGNVMSLFTYPVDNVVIKRPSKRVTL
jgi:hypothetical protein